MRALPAPVLLLTLAAAGCAARIPPETSFSPSAWAAVERIKPGERIEVRYVTGDPPLRHSFEGTFLSANTELLEIATKQGRQRLLANRVTQVAIGGREDRMIELASVGVLAGGVLFGMQAAISEKNDRETTLNIVSGAVGGGVLGALAGARRGQSRPRVVYSRSAR